MSKPSNTKQFVAFYMLTIKSWISVCGRCGTNSRSGSKIVHGSAVPLGEVPWQVGLDNEAPGNISI